MATKIFAASAPAPRSNTHRHPKLEVSNSRGEDSLSMNQTNNTAYQGWFYDWVEAAFVGPQ